MVQVAARSHGITFDELHARLDAERNTHVDAIVSTGEHVALEVDRGDVAMFFMTPEIPELDGTRARMTDYMHGQLASRTGIDRKYYERMRQSQPGLLVRNVETWWTAEPEMRLVRTVRPALVDNGSITIGDLTGRAWLSDRYRTLDNYEFIVAVLEEADKHKATIASCHLDDERVYMKLVSERMQGEVKRGDVLQAGVIVKNSEVGDGKVLVQPYVERLICTNGLVRPEQFTQVHLGGQNEAGILQQDTLEAEGKSVWLQVRDWVKAVFEGEFLQRTVREFQQAEGIRVRVPARLAVANVVRNYGLTGSDGQSVLERYLRGNDESMFGLVNALTQHAHEGTDSYRRQVELETFGGKLLAAPNAFEHLVTTPLSEEQILKAVNAN